MNHRPKPRLCRDPSAGLWICFSDHFAARGRTIAGAFNAWMDIAEALAA